MISEELKRCLKGGLKCSIFIMWGKPAMGDWRKISEGRLSWARALWTVGIPGLPSRCWSDQWVGGSDEVF